MVIISHVGAKSFTDVPTDVVIEFGHLIGSK